MEAPALACEIDIIGRSVKMDKTIVFACPPFGLPVIGDQRIVTLELGTVISVDIDSSYLEIIEITALGHCKIAVGIIAVEIALNKHILISRTDDRGTEIQAIADNVGIAAYNAYHTFMVPAAVGGFTQIYGKTVGGKRVGDLKILVKMRAAALPLVGNGSLAGKSGVGDQAARSAVNSDSERSAICRAVFGVLERFHRRRKG